MKMKSDHYATLKSAIATNAHKIEAHLNYIVTYSNAKDANKRLRWDMLYLSKRELPAHWVCDTLYPYLNDDHIDTALRQIIAELSA